MRSVIYICSFLFSCLISSSTIESEMVPIIRTTSYIMRTYPHLKREDAYRCIVSVYKYSREYNISPDLLMAVIHTESTYRPSAVSREGACGLTQIQPRWWAKELMSAGILTVEEDIFDIDRNIEAGAYVLSQYISTSKDIPEALYRYNGGGIGYADKVLKRQRHINQHGGII